MPRLPPTAACAWTNCSCCAANLRRARGPAMRSSVAPSASKARSRPSPARAFPARRGHRGRRPGAALCFARRAEADRRPRPFPLRPARLSRARYRRFDRRFHAGAAGARRSACERHRRRARPVRGSTCRRSARQPDRRSRTRAISTRDHLPGPAARFHRLRRQLHLAAARPASGAGARGARAQRRSCWSSRNSRPAARRSARAACCAIPRWARASPKTCAPGWTRCRAGRRSGVCPSPIDGGDGNREFLLAGTKTR